MDNLKVLMMPDYRRDNPYQELLAHGLRENGCQVVFPNGYRRGLPIVRAVRDEPGTRILHLHWTGPYVRGSNRLTFAGRLVKFLADLDAVRLSGVKIAWTVHNLIPHEARFPKLEIAARRAICRRASAVIVHGQASREEALRRLACPADRIAVIPHGHYRRAYDVALPCDEARRQLDLAGDAKAILFFGFLRPYKGLETLLAAWRKLSPSGAELLIVGQPHDAAYTVKLRQMAEGRPGVRIVDRFVPSAEVPLYFSAADAVVLPFRMVQTSGSVILAMSYGRPVIAPRLGEVPEALVGADDLLFARGDEDELGNSLERALASDLSDLAERTARACDRLDWAPIASATADVYRRALGWDPVQPSGRQVRIVRQNGRDRSDVPLPEAERV
jgi:glycosyltransferase involved in cell wall biosynthesis